VKIIKCEQGSPKWHRERLGIPTASEFERILTPATRKLSTQAKSYRYELLSEWLTGTPHGSDATLLMERGIKLEPQARSWYEYERGCTVETVGLVKSDDEMVACSPDGFVGDDGGIEIKCPAASTHVRYLVEGFSGYTGQAQGALWLTGRAWWDLVAFHPELPSIIVRVERDEEFIADLAAAVAGFVGELQEARSMLLKRGCSPRALIPTMAMIPAGDEPF
jgi:hypothetical protein